MASLPSGYTKLDYIESSGTQYIDTGVSSFQTQRTRVILDVDWLSGLGCYFGCFKSGLGWYVEAIQPTKIRSGYLSESKSAGIATVIGRYTVEKKRCLHERKRSKNTACLGGQLYFNFNMSFGVRWQLRGVRYCRGGKNLFVQDLFKLSTYQAIRALQKFLR